MSDDMREALAGDLLPLVIAAENYRHDTEGCTCGGECFRESDLRAGALEWADYVLASDAVARIKAAAWDEGFSFGHWLDRGYGVEGARGRGVPEHLTGELGLTEPIRYPGDDEPEPIWNPYRANPRTGSEGA